MPTFNDSFLVSQSKTYWAGDSKPIQSVFHFSFNRSAELTELEGIVLDAALALSLETQTFFASLETLANKCSITKHQANKTLRRLAAKGFLALTKEPRQQQPDPDNPHHWKLKGYFHPHLFDEVSFVASLLAGLEALETSQQLQFAGEKRGELVDLYQCQNLVIQPTVAGEKRPLFTVETWESFSSVEKTFHLTQSSESEFILQVPDGMVVIDFDSVQKHDIFLSSLSLLERESFEQTVIVKTPRGFHYYFVTPEKFSQVNTEFYDVRPAGSWLVVPSGGSERGFISEGTCALLPIGVISDQSQLEVSCNKAPTKVETGRGFAVGNRNNKLFRLFRGLRFTCKDFTQFFTKCLLIAERCIEPLPVKELYRLIKHSWKMKNRRGFVPCSGR